MDFVAKSPDSATELAEFVAKATAFATKFTPFATKKSDFVAKGVDFLAKSLPFSRKSLKISEDCGNDQDRRNNSEAKAIMSAYDYLPTKDTVLNGWINNFTQSCAELQQELGLSNLELAELQSEAAGFTDALNDYFSMLASARAATEEKNAKRDQIISKVRALTREFKANVDVDTSDLIKLGVVKPRIGKSLQPVKSLVIVPFGEGINLIKWDRNENIPATNFIIECSPVGQNDFRFVGSTTKTRFKHLNQVPGRALWYRVFASRAGKTSPSCPPVSVYYSDESAQELRAA